MTWATLSRPPAGERPDAGTRAVPGQGWMGNGEFRLLRLRNIRGEIAAKVKAWQPFRSRSASDSARAFDAIPGLQLHDNFAAPGGYRRLFDSISMLEVLAAVMLCIRARL